MKKMAARMTMMRRMVGVILFSKLIAGGGGGGGGGKDGSGSETGERRLSPSMLSCKNQLKENK